MEVNQTTLGLYAAVAGIGAILGGAAYWLATEAPPNSNWEWLGVFLSAPGELLSWRLAPPFIMVPLYGAAALPGTAYLVARFRRLGARLLIAIGLLSLHATALGVMFWTAAEGYQLWVWWGEESSSTIPSTPAPHDAVK